MSRQKVSHDRRQRTAQACDYCKRRKQKCNGEVPCSACSAKKVTCTYSPSNVSRTTTRPPRPKRHRTRLAAGLGTSASAAAAAAAAAAAEAFASSPEFAAALATQQRQRFSKARGWTHFRGRPPSELEELLLQGGLTRHPYSYPFLPPVPAARSSTAAESVFFQDEEPVLEHAPRLLEDGAGRLLYIGDSATLSFLHRLRRLVESVSGPSDFTTDPSQGSIVEPLVDLPPQIRPPSMLPDRETANVLVASFFTNTSGLVKVFDRNDFVRSLDALYGEPLSSSNQFLCLLFLTLAIGLVMATPAPGTVESSTVQRLADQPFDQAELFFQSATCLCDPVAKLADADFWSVQALTLISLYMLAVSKRNAAYAYHGMAVRSAMALGLHRADTMANFEGSPLQARRNVWASLYVLDRFLAASLGRPLAIHEDECSEAALDDASLPHVLKPESCSHPAVETAETETAHVLGINANVHSCRIMGNVLRKLYARRRVSTAAAQDIVQQCGNWTRSLDACLRWHSRTSVPPSERPGLSKRSCTDRIAILHVNLIYCHSVILFTRPFFLFLVQANRHGPSQTTPSLRARTEKFAEVCVTASFHTITMLQDALDLGVLSRRNPFAIYFIFTAALLIMSNELFALFLHPAYAKFATQAISIMEYFAKADVQATRQLYILRELQKTVAAAQAKHDVTATDTSGDATTLPDDTERPFHYQFPAYVIKEAYDPVSLLFASHTVKRNCFHSTAKTRTAETEEEDRQQLPNSNATTTPPPTATVDHVDPSFYYPTPFTPNYLQSSLPGADNSFVDTAGTPLQSVALFQSRSAPVSYDGTPDCQSRPAADYATTATGSPSLHTPVHPPSYFAPSQTLPYSTAHGSEQAGVHYVGGPYVGPPGGAASQLDLALLWNWHAHAALAGGDAVAAATADANALLSSAGVGETPEHGSYPTPVCVCGDVSTTYLVVGGDEGVVGISNGNGTPGDRSRPASSSPSPLPVIYASYNNVPLPAPGGSIATAHDGMMDVPMMMYPTEDVQ